MTQAVDTKLGHEPCGAVRPILHQRLQRRRQEHRSQHWDSDHRTWEQRGGYNGYRIPAAHVRAKFTESLPDGREAKRTADVYGVVHGGDIWIVRCFNALDAADAKGCQQVLDSLSFGS